MSNITTSDISATLSEEFYCMLRRYDKTPYGTARADAAKEIDGFMKAVRTLAQLDKSLEALYEQFRTEW